jgi:predicted RNase H-like HicB family nuclease
MRRYYPAILERGPKGSVGLSFPDFPGHAAGGTSQEQAMEKAESVLAQAVEGLAEREQPLPQPSALEAIAIPDKAAFIAFVMIGVEPPDPSERVNIYLPRRLIQRADARAAELGMSRSSYFGLAISTVLGSLALPVHTAALAEFWKRQTPGPVGGKKKAP